MILKFVTAVMGVLMSLGYYPQAYRIWKTKSARDVAVSSYIIFALGTAVWLAYGLVLRDPVIVMSFALGVGGSWLALFLTLLYKKKHD